MVEETSIETKENPYHKPQRLQWLLGEYEKHLHRFEASRKSMDQKAIWALATATGFVGFLGLVKGEDIGVAIYARFSNQVVDIDTSQKIHDSDRHAVYADLSRPTDQGDRCLFSEKGDRPLYADQLFKYNAGKRIR